MPDKILYTGGPKEEFNLLKTLKDIESTYSGKHKKTLTEVIEYAEKMEKQGYYFDNGDWIKKSEKVDKKLTFCDKCGEMIVKGEVHECIVSQPELEESQEDLCIIETNRWTKTRRIYPLIFLTEQEVKDFIKTKSTVNNTFEIFTIQRKK